MNCEFFNSAFTVEDCTSIPQLPDDYHSPLTTITITSKMVFDKLRNTAKRHQSPWPRGLATLHVHSWFVKILF